MFCALAVLAEERNPVECLDAFGATGWTFTLILFLLLSHLVPGILAGMLGMEGRSSETNRFW